MKKKTMDGNTAASHVAYAFTEVAGIYPITPSSVMAEHVDKWAAQGMKNIFGQTVKVAEMQSEAGAAGTVHGSLASGALTTTFTASQGLLLMIPNMYKIAGELLPGVIHCSARALASHALSIFGDHSDVMSCRQTGFAMLASTNPQEVMHLGAVAHLAAIEGRVPFLHFFDGFRTSHEMQKIEVWDYDTLAGMLDFKAVQAFRDNALNPDHPVLRGTAQNPDIFFQAREACNNHYLALPCVVENYMAKVNAAAGTDYKLFNYYGHPQAERVIVAMGSVCDTIEETIDFLAARGEKVGLVKVRLYRPWVAKKFIDALPPSVKRIAVLDRTKEPGALGEPLYLDVVTTLAHTLPDVKVVGGRYGLGSKDAPPAVVLAVYKNLADPAPKNGFTIGIDDDVTHLSLPLGENPDTTPAGIVSCKFWGLGSDGTVGANKNSIKIIGDHTDQNVQAYFAYDSKKSGGITISHLRFGHAPIKSTYFVSKADFVACHNPSYVDKYKMVEDVKPGGTFLLNCPWGDAELSEHLPGPMKRYIAQNNIKLFTVDGIDLARGINKRGLGVNVILQAAFFKLSKIIPLDDAVTYMKKAIVDTYGSKGEEVVNNNYKCVDAGIQNVREVAVPAEWKSTEGEYPRHKAEGGRPELVSFVNDILTPVNAQLGDHLPVSAFADTADGTFPQGSAAYEKRGIAVDVPRWLPEHCIQCNQCSYVCPHAAIRPFALDEKELAAAPAGIKSAKLNGKGCEGLSFSLLTSVLDCTGCVSCVNTCPAKEKALVMTKLEEMSGEQKYYDYAFANVAEKPAVAEAFKPDSVKGSQFLQPLLEFSGACAGCGETPYAKLATQLFGDRMMIANATGCSSIWGGSAPATPYTVNRCGKGPAWANSLFEDNAEYGYGMVLGVHQRRERLAEKVRELAGLGWTDAPLKQAAQEWLDAKDCGAGSKEAAAKLLAAARDGTDVGDGSKFTGEYAKYWDKENKWCTCQACTLAREVIAGEDMLVKKSVWVLGGDGWAYDIGFGGLDHVLASGEDINVLVFDTEVYSNTGGQASKASQIGQVAQFADSGKHTAKKDLAQIAISYGYVYVAQVAMGASMPQTIKAFTEAESYKGPSLIIAYSTCINHGVKGGMSNAMAEMKKAVEAGYWHNFRFDPRLKAEGKNPFQLDSAPPSAAYGDFILTENRYASLTRQYPERAKELFAKATEAAEDKYKKLSRFSKLFEE
ncbi:MAG: pyruvate:ferredoxin (flavodoxin) oxidoreductase [Oscillospiraceae bacterium]|jgi:pyruvate-ferredoxin/flavodoxin oxidoreductase|nr:pyruvate:ferredoxin (flavodoxin) oxidoreductase [Oscillospiraceae bacterium]